MRPEAAERDRGAAAIGALPGLLLHRCEPMRNAYGVVALPDGFPDWFVAAEGIIVLVEWKAKTGRLNPAQIAYHAALAAAGVIVLIARDAGQCCRDLAARFGGETAVRLLKCAEELDNKKVANSC